MRKNVIIPILGCLSLGVLFQIVESSVLSFRYGPDLLLALSCAASWVSSAGTSALCCFFVGLLRDVTSGRMLGLEALSMTLGSLTVTFMKRYLPVDGTFSRSIAAFCGSLVMRVTGFAIVNIMGLRVGTWFFLKEILPADVLWTSVLVWPVGAVFSRFVGQLFRAFQGEGKKGRVEYEHW